MSLNDLWECGECQRVLVHKTSAARHWKDEQKKGNGHWGPINLVCRPGGRSATSAPLRGSATVAVAANTTAQQPFPLVLGPVSVLSLPPAPAPAPVSASVVYSSEWPSACPSSQAWVYPPLPAPFVDNVAATVMEQPTSSSSSVSSLIIPSTCASSTNSLLQLRSSRSTRNQDHQAASRNRPAVLDLDPTEGLPVQKWEHVSVKVNQDPSTDPSSNANLPSAATTTSSAEWAAQFNTPQYPWSEKPLPPFLPQLQPWNQEMIRRARTGNTNPKLSVWDSKTNSWLSAAEAEKRQKTLKSVHLNNLDPNTGSKQNAAPDSPAHEADDDHDDKSDDEVDVDNADDDIAPASKRRKKYMPEERTFEVKRWVQVPSAVADKTEERKFLADRRAGMPSLYGGPYQNQVFGSMGLSTNGYGYSVANAGYDFSDGAALGHAGGVLQSNDGNATPVRKNMPPKRKKKKGGPGRKKANPNPISQGATNTEANGTADTSNVDANTASRPAEDITMIDVDNEGSDSGSEGEGSEEGEIDEGGQDNKQNDQADQPIAVPDNLEVEEKSMLIESESEVKNEQHQVTEENTDTGSTKVTANVSDVDPELESNKAPLDTSLEEQVVTQDPADIPPEPEVIPSIIPPPVSEQLPEIQEVPEAPEAPEATEATEVREVPEVPEVLPILAAPPEPVALVSPPFEQVTEILQSDPVPQESIAETVQSEEPQIPDPEPVIAPSIETSGLETASVEPATELPPIVTVVAETIEQPSITAAVTEQPVAEAPEIVAPPIPVQVTIPEPTSPDLLGGLEDELDKNMEEHNTD